MLGTVKARSRSLAGRRAIAFRCASRPAMTLIELVTVLAIVGVLVAILLPAVQAVRESGRRMQCANRVKQLALAALNYESGRRQLPVGSHNSYWRTWLVQLLPYIEEQPLYDAYDHRLYLPASQFNVGRNAPLTTRLLGELACPNDPPVRSAFGTGASAHSYVACTGNGEYVATEAGWNTTPPVVGVGITMTHAIAQTSSVKTGAAVVISGSTSITVSQPNTISESPMAAVTAATGTATGTTTQSGTSKASSVKAVPLLPILAPFFLLDGTSESSPEKKFQGGAYQMSGGSTDLTPAEDPDLLRDAIAVRLSEITDGLSTTLAFSEVMRARDEDGTPAQDYRGLSWWGPGALFSTRGTPNSHLPDVMPRTGDCGSDEEAPCVSPHTKSQPMSVLARSRHPGGVVAATCDGAVAFYPNEIDAIVWENLGTTHGDRTP